MFSRITRIYLFDKNPLRVFSLKNQTLRFCSRESEDSYFSLQPNKLNETKKKTDAPIKKILASTNKSMFGPLLETAKEKRQRLKYETLGKEMPKKAKKRQFERMMKDEDYESLLDKPENSHLLGIFNDDQNTQRNMKSQGSSSKENLSSNEKIIKKIPTKVIIANSNYSAKSSTKLRKLTFGPQGNENSYNLRKVDNQNKENFSFETQRITRIILPNKSNDSSKHSKKLIESDSVVEDYPRIDSELLKDSKEAKKVKDFQGFSKYSNASQITIDNSKWTAAPKIINLNELRKITLVPPNYVTKQKEDEFVKTIGIFEGGYQKLPSVTKILDETMPISSRMALDRWKAKMIAELGEQGFAEYQQNTLDTGKTFHGCIETRLHNKEPLTEELARCSGHWQSIEAVLPGVTNIVALESRILHPNLYYQGLVDCVAHYRSKPVLIEWKTSKKPKTTVKSMYDNPLQVAAYIGALNYDSNYSLQQPIDSGLLVAAYECGAPADVHLLTPQDCQNFWNIWLNRLTMFWQKQKIIFPIN